MGNQLGFLSLSETEANPQKPFLLLWVRHRAKRSNTAALLLSLLSKQQTNVINNERYLIDGQKPGKGILYRVLIPCFLPHLALTWYVGHERVRVKSQWLSNLLLITSALPVFIALSGRGCNPHLHPDVNIYIRSLYSRSEWCGAYSAYIMPLRTWHLLLTHTELKQRSYTNSQTCGTSS